MIFQKKSCDFKHCRDISITCLIVVLLIKLILLELIETEIVLSKRECCWNNVASIISLHKAAAVVGFCRNTLITHDLRFIGVKLIKQILISLCVCKDWFAYHITFTYAGCKVYYAITVCCFNHTDCRRHKQSSTYFIHIDCISKCFIWASTPFK